MHSLFLLYLHIVESQDVLSIASNSRTVLHAWQINLKLNKYARVSAFLPANVYIAKRIIERGLKLKLWPKCIFSSVTLGNLEVLVSIPRSSLRRRLLYLTYFSCNERNTNNQSSLNDSSSNQSFPGSTFWTVRIWCFFIVNEISLGFVLQL